jgi:hypothetical protein
MDTAWDLCPRKLGQFPQSDEHGSWVNRHLISQVFDIVGIFFEFDLTAVAGTVIA